MRNITNTQKKQVWTPTFEFMDILNKKGNLCFWKENFGVSLDGKWPHGQLHNKTMRTGNQTYTQEYTLFDRESLKLLLKDWKAHSEQVQQKAILIRGRKDRKTSNLIKHYEIVLKLI